MSRSTKFSLVVLVSAISAATLTSCSTVDQITGVDLDVPRVEKMIEDGVQAQGGFSVTASCPDPMAGQVGDTRTCSVVDEFGNTGLVDVTIQNDNGDVIWKLQN